MDLPIETSSVSRDDPTSIKLLAKTRERTLCAFLWGVLRLQQLRKGNGEEGVFPNRSCFHAVNRLSRVKKLANNEGNALM